MYPQRLSFAKLRRCNFLWVPIPNQMLMQQANNEYKFPTPVKLYIQLGKINKGIMTTNSHPGLNCTDKYVIPSNPLHEILPSDWFSRTPMATSMISEWSHYSMH